MREEEAQWATILQAEHAHAMRKVADKHITNPHARTGTKGDEASD